MSTLLTSHIREMRMGWSATKLIISLRWRLVRLRKTKVLITFGGVFVLVGLIASINIGYALSLSIKQQNVNQNINIQTMLSYILHAAQNNFGAVFLISIFAMAIFAPFAGSSTVSLFPSEDLQSIRPNETHRFFDSIIINCVSGIGLLQLLTLTGITSILTMDINKFIPLLLSWGLWFFLVTLMTTVGWTLEYTVRKFGKIKRRITGLLLTLAFGGGFFASAYFGKSPFAIGNSYIREIRNTGSHGIDSQSIILIVSIILGIIVLFIVGSFITKKALLLSAPSTSMGLGHRAPKLTTSLKNLSISLLFKTLWRTGECRKPIIAILCFGAPAMFFSSTTTNLGPILIIAIPLTVALSWGVNSFGILGTGMNWVASQPKLIKKLPFYSFIIQFLLVLAMTVFLWLLAFFSGHSSIHKAIPLFAAIIISSIGTSVYSSYLSIKHPVRTQLTSRGNALVPPLTALAYLLQLIIIASIPSTIMTLKLPFIWQFTSMDCLFASYMISLIALEVIWKGAETRARVIQIVSAP